MKSKIIAIVVAVLVVAAAITVYVRFYFVFGEGVKAGELNKMEKKGWVWKTYEGRVIQTGFKSSKSSGNLQSNEFNFSVTDSVIADSLMRCSGKSVELRYKEYLGRLPWRGMQKHIVYEILSVKSYDGLSTDIPVVTAQ